MWRKALVPAVLCMALWLTVLTWREGRTLYGAMTCRHPDYLIFDAWARMNASGDSMANTKAAEATYRVTPKIDPWQYYPPSLLAFLRPLTWLSQETAEFLFYSAMIVAAVIYAATCGVLSGNPVGGTLLAFFVSSQALYIAWSFGQVTPFTSALFAFALLYLRQSNIRASAVLIAAATAIKPLEGFLWLFPALRREGAFLTAFVAFVVFEAASLAVTGPDPWWTQTGGVWKTLLVHGCFVPFNYALPVAALLAFACPKESR